MSRFPDLSKYPVVAVDTETNGTNWYEKPYSHGPVFGIAIATPDHHAYYYDIRTDRDALEWARRELPKVRSWCAHFAAFDYHMLLSAGVELPDDRAICTMTDAALINEHLLQYDLDSLGLRYLDQRKEISIYDELANLFGGNATKNVQMPNLHRAPERIVAKYAKQDALLCLRLHMWQRREIANQALDRVVALERRVWPALRRMERRGVRVNVPAAEKAMESISRDCDQLQQDLNRRAGFPVNPNPSGSIHKLFKPERISDRAFRLVDGTIASATAGGKASINADVLKAMKHPAAAMILELRQMIRMRDVFIAGHILGSHVDGWVHPTINQTRTTEDSGTGTGRLSYTGPALQQIPARNRRVASEEMERRDGSIWLKPGQDTLDMLDKYHDSVPGIKRYLERADAVAKKRGHVITGGGRHLRFPGKKATHKAGGLILQGTSADGMKIKVAEVDEFLRDRDADLLLSVHDELDVEMDPRDDKTREGIREIQEDFGPESTLPLVVPIRVDVGCGPDWWQASKA